MAEEKALIDPDATPPLLPGMANLSVLRQAGILLGIAASVALGVAVALWSQTAEMKPVGHFSPDKLSDVINYLEQNKVDYKLSPDGTLMVEEAKLQKVKLDLTAQGLTGVGAADQFLKQDSGFGVSQRLEQARLLRAKENELAASISRFAGVKAATVHIAIPVRSSFIGRKEQPRASVALQLFTNSPLKEEQAEAIVDLVVGAVPGLERHRVAVTDQFGRLYNTSSNDAETRAIDKEFKAELKKQKELEQKIAELLSPIVGPENFTAQVTVDLDFTEKEQTQQLFNPDEPAVTEEKLMESTNGEGEAAGIPGALSNQPPAAAQIPETGAANSAGEKASSGTIKRRVESQRRYQLDTTISHVRQAIGRVAKINVAVGLNYLTKTDENGDTQRVPRPKEEIERIRRLVESVVGFEAARGDSVIVDTFDFVPPAQLPETPPPPFYEQPIFKALWKPVVALLSLLLLIFGVLKPTFNKLSQAPESASMQPLPMAPEGGATIASPGDEQLMLSSEEEHDMLPGASKRELEQVKRAKKIVEEDPKMVAALVQNWIEEDNE
ncbi:MAG: flagellar M-ring protein FliF [Gammaproteobacteria bacterium]|nr:MAG: flagellar M-ring protein FliF [Gammaproteobacteria bacterium]